MEINNLISKQNDSLEEINKEIQAKEIKVNNTNIRILRKYFKHWRNITYWRIILNNLLLNQNNNSSKQEKILFSPTTVLDSKYFKSIFSPIKDDQNNHSNLSIVKSNNFDLNLTKSEISQNELLNNNNNITIEKKKSQENKIKSKKNKIIVNKKTFHNKIKNNNNSYNTSFKTPLSNNITLNNSSNYLVNDTFNNSYSTINSILTVENKKKKFENKFIFENETSYKFMKSNLDKLIYLDNNFNKFFNKNLIQINKYFCIWKSLLDNKVIVKKLKNYKNNSNKALLKKYFNKLNEISTKKNIINNLILNNINNNYLVTVQSHINNNTSTSIQIPSPSKSFCQSSIYFKPIVKNSFSKSKSSKIKTDNIINNKNYQNFIKKLLNIILCHSFIYSIKKIQIKAISNIYYIIIQNFINKIINKKKELFFYFIDKLKNFYSEINDTNQNLENKINKLMIMYEEKNKELELENLKKEEKKSEKLEIIEEEKSIDKDDDEFKINLIKFVEIINKLLNIQKKTIFNKITFYLKDKAKKFDLLYIIVLIIQQTLLNKYWKLFKLGLQFKNEENQNNNIKYNKDSLSLDNLKKNNNNNYNNNNLLKDNMNEINKNNYNNEELIYNNNFYYIKNNNSNSPFFNSNNNNNSDLYIDDLKNSNLINNNLKTNIKINNNNNISNSKKYKNNIFQGKKNLKIPITTNFKNVLISNNTPQSYLNNSEELNNNLSTNGKKNISQVSMNNNNSSYMMNNYLTYNPENDDNLNDYEFNDIETLSSPKYSTKNTFLQQSFNNNSKDTPKFNKIDSNKFNIINNSLNNNNSYYRKNNEQLLSSLSDNYMNNNTINYSNNNINYSNNINNNSNITSSIVNNSIPNNNSNIYYSQINDQENQNINYNNINSNRNSITQNSNSIPLSYNNNYQSINNDKINNRNNYYSNNNNIALTEELKNYNLDNTMTSGVSESYLSGVSLIETDNKKFIPIDYTSQSFFIDKEYLNLQESRNEKTNNQPMQLKGDFEKLLDNNNNMFIKNKSNTRIQITNASFPVEKLIQNELNKGNIRPDQENLREIIGENVVRKCDKDIYSNNDGNNKNSTSIRKNKDIDFNKKYSMSFPIKENNVLKWEFLNNIKGKRYSTDTNKFELIQKKNVHVKNNSNDFDSNTVMIPGRKNKYETFTLKYKLKELNTSQFYHTPNKINNYFININNNKNSRNIENKLNSSASATNFNYRKKGGVIKFNINNNFHKNNNSTINILNFNKDKGKNKHRKNNSLSINIKNEI